MHIFDDKNGRKIRLTEERKEHFESEHPEMRNQEEQVALTLRDPDRVVRSKTDNEIELHYRFFDNTPVTSKFLCVVVKVKDQDLFIVTVYFTDSIKRGEVLWEKKK